MMGEQRRQKRIMQENKVMVHVLDQKPDAPSTSSFIALTKDLSLEGAKIITENKLQTGTMLQIELSLEKPHKIIYLKATVKWIRSLYDDEVFEMGIEYIDQQPHKIIDLLKHLYCK